MARPVHINRSGSVFIGTFVDRNVKPPPHAAPTNSSYIRHNTTPTRAVAAAAVSPPPGMSASMVTSIAAAQRVLDALEEDQVPPPPPSPPRAKKGVVRAEQPEVALDDYATPSWSDTMAAVDRVLGNLNEAMSDAVDTGATVEEGFAAVGRHVELRDSLGAWRRAAITRYLPMERRHRIVFVDSRAVDDVRLPEEQWRWVAAPAAAATHSAAPITAEREARSAAVVEEAPIAETTTATPAITFDDFSNFLARVRAFDAAAGGAAGGPAAAAQTEDDIDIDALRKSSSEAAVPPLNSVAPPLGGALAAPALPTSSAAPGPRVSLDTIESLSEWALRNVVQTHGRGEAAALAALAAEQGVKRTCVEKRIKRGIEEDRAAAAAASSSGVASRQHTEGEGVDGGPGVQAQVDRIEATLRQIVAHSSLLAKKKGKKTTKEEEGSRRAPAATTVASSPQCTASSSTSEAAVNAPDPRDVQLERAAQTEQSLREQVALLNKRWAGARDSVCRLQRQLDTDERAAQHLKEMSELQGRLVESMAAGRKAAKMQQWPATTAAPVIDDYDDELPCEACQRRGETCREPSCSACAKMRTNRKVRSRHFSATIV